MADSKATKKNDKHGEKKDENFLARAAHSIRDKVHGLTDEIKEKTHHKSQGNDPKKSKKTGDDKKSPNPHPSTGPKSEDHKRPDSDEEDYDKPTPPLPSSNKKYNPTDSKPSSTSENKPAAAPSSSEDKLSAAKPETSTATANKPASNVSFKEPPTEDAQSKPAGENPPSTQQKPSSTTQQNAPSSGQPNPPSTTQQNPPPATQQKAPAATNATSPERVHLSFDGIVTVDDLLNRIDETLENSKLIVENGIENTAVNIQQTQKPPAAANPEQKPAESKKAPNPASEAEKKPVEQTNAQNPAATDEKREDDPIRLDYLEIKSIGDILLKINDQPGNRRVVLENAPDPNAAAAAAAPKSILKSSQDPSSVDTSTKVAALDDSEIHVDLAGVQKLDDLLDRIDDTVAQVPVLIETSPREGKDEASQSANATQSTQTEPPKNQAPPAATNAQPQKSQAPPAPAGTNDQPKKTEAPSSAAGNDQSKKSQAPVAPAGTNAQGKKDEEKSGSNANGEKKPDDIVPKFHVPEHEYGQNQPPISQQAAPEAKKTDDGTEWI